MREFSLQNKIGEVYRLNSLDYFLHDPEGLGFRRNANYQKIGSTYTMLRDGFEQQPISARIMFKTSKTLSAYRQYTKFKEFLQLIPLTLIYRIPGGEYRLDCVPESVEKTEINSVLGMDIGLVLTPLTMWYREIIAEPDNLGDVSIISDSAIESPCHAIFTASGYTPTYVQYTWGWTVDGVSAGDGSIVEVDPVFEAGTELHVRTDTNPYQIYSIDTHNYRRDLYKFSNFSKKRFITLNKGVNKITAGTGLNQVTVKARIYYETV